MENDNQVAKEVGRKAGWFERLYGKTATLVMKAANPFKKFAFKTPCLMHRYINIQAVHILENEGYYEAADFYRDHIRPLNEGATWIDQDFKSINHFYHHEKGKGLFGFSDALTEAKKYRKRLKKQANRGNLTRAIFYTGVICHLTQDMTVPQHINNKLLDSHRDYEVWILANAWDKEDFTVKDGLIRFEKFSHYITENAKAAHELGTQCREMTDSKEGYRQLSRAMVARAQRTTAGLLLDFYEKWFCHFEEAAHTKRQHLRLLKEGKVI